MRTSPKTHNTMLYPLLVNDNPIQEHYFKTWHWLTEEYVNIIQPKDELLNSL